MSVVHITFLLFCLHAHKRLSEIKATVKKSVLVHKLHTFFHFFSTSILQIIVNMKNDSFNVSVLFET